MQDGEIEASPSDWLLFGLGNPGTSYERTRHNLGWMPLASPVADRLRSRHAAGRWIAAPNNCANRALEL